MKSWGQSQWAIVWITLSIVLSLWLDLANHFYWDIPSYIAHNRENFALAILLIGITLLWHGTLRPFATRTLLLCASGVGLLAIVIIVHNVVARDSKKPHPKEDCRTSQMCSSTKASESEAPPPPAGFEIIEESAVPQGRAMRRSGEN
jgi:hypothetical protein